MNRHTPSFFVSVLVHLAFAMMLFLLYKSAVLLNAKKEEQRVCIHLQTLQTPQIATITKELKSPKKVKTPKKQQISKKIEPIQKKKIAIKKPKEISKKIKKQKKVIKPLKAKKVIEKVKTVETTSLLKAKQAEKKEIIKKVLQEQEQKTPQEIYIDENLQKISQLLSENLYYPRRARKRGIEGVVNVNFTLDTEAVVSEIDVVSSKSDILSRAAIRTLEELSGEFPRPRETLRLSVPISYSLKR